MRERGDVCPLRGGQIALGERRETLDSRPMTGGVGGIDAQARGVRVEQKLFEMNARRESAPLKHDPR